MKCKVCGSMPEFIEFSTISKVGIVTYTSQAKCPLCGRMGPKVVGFTQHDAHMKAWEHWKKRNE